MAYTPPAFNAVSPNFTTTGYTPPAYNAVNVNFGTAPSTKSRRKPWAWQFGSKRGNSYKGTK
jgi:hypothetical protein